MKRKAFISELISTYVGTMLIPTLAGCFDQEDFDKSSLFDSLPDVNTNQDIKVAIVGAGIAGMFAGYLLKNKGFDVTIYEHEERIGGRIFSRKNSDTGNFFELGASFFNSNDGHIGDLIQASNSYQIKTNPFVFSYIRDNTIVDEATAKNLDSMSGFFSLRNAIEKQLFLDTEKNIPSAYKLFSDNYSENEKIINSYAAIFGGIPEAINAHELSLKLYEKELLTYEFETTNTQEKLFESLFPGVQSLINRSIDFITINNDTVELQQSSFNYVFLTPNPEMVQKNITFSPSLPKETTEALGKLHLPKGKKISFKFQTALWDSSTRYVLGSDICSYYYCNTSQVFSRKNVLEAIFVGDHADFENIEKKKVEILEELSRLFPEKILSVVDTSYRDWSGGRIGGIRSYPIANGRTIRKILSEPVYEKIYFCGESYNTNNNYGTVEGALESAYSSVLKLIENINR